MTHKDARLMWKGNPFILSNLMSMAGLDDIIRWIKKYALPEEISEPNLCR